jgi:hypothetical protein
VKNKASFLRSAFLIALCVTCCTLLIKDVKANQDQNHPQEKIQGLVLSCSGISFGFEDCTRSYENFVSPLVKAGKDLDYVLVEKVQSIFTKVSFKYLFVLQLLQKKEKYLFLDLCKLLI